jgi:hypothetical protein
LVPGSMFASGEKSNGVSGSAAFVSGVYICISFLPDGENKDPWGCRTTLMA